MDRHLNTEPGDRPPLSSETRRLISQAGRGGTSGRAALEAIWNEHRPWLAVVILAHRPRTVDVEDLMQDVALKMIDHIGELRDPAAIKPWLRSIALNVCRGAARAMKPSASLPGSDGWACSVDARLPDRSPASLPEAIARDDEARRLLEKLLGLPMQYREPLLLRCVGSSGGGGMSYEHIGEALGLPVSTVETRIARARRMLREEMNEYADQQL